MSADARWRHRMDPDELRLATRVMCRELHHWGHDVVEGAVTGGRGEPAGTRPEGVLWTARRAWATMRWDDAALWDVRSCGASHPDGKRGHGPA